MCIITDIITKEFQTNIFLRFFEELENEEKQFLNDIHNYRLRQKYTLV